MYGDAGIHSSVDYVTTFSYLRFHSVELLEDWWIIKSKLYCRNTDGLIEWIAKFIAGGNNNIIYLLQMGCHPVAVITLYVFPNTANKFT
jgi:hypothetical protein